MRKNFHEINIIHEEFKTDKSILLFCNHISWWDGFWALYTNIKIFEKKFHFMMLENELKSRPIFKSIGGYSIQPKSKDIINSLNYTKSLLENQNNLVLVFPEAKIHSIYNDHIVFEKGLRKVLNQQQHKLVFMFNTIEYGNKKNPTLNINIKNHTKFTDDITKINQSYQKFCSKIIGKQKQFTI
jgi:hypothetical protein